ncbi:hypothetical protein [Lacrimispora sphenoides]|nr:hypothetical protein [Lacrimispora sphenoides]
MAKIIFEEKLKVVQAYLNGEGGYKMQTVWAYRQEPGSQLV